MKDIEFIDLEKDDDFRGTFTDNRSAPIHRWFNYSAGFSFEAVHKAIDTYGLKEGDFLLDPFAGVGTACVVAKERGIDSLGCETHPYAQWIGNTKLNWDFDFDDLSEQIHLFMDKLSPLPSGNDASEILVKENPPEFLFKLFENEKHLAQLYYIRNVLDDPTSASEGLFLDKSKYYNLFKLGLVILLRKASTSHAGWQYALPRYKKKGVSSILTSYRNILNMMKRDMEKTVDSADSLGGGKIVREDARDLSFLNRKADLAFTSPPYLNNFDYADWSRMDLYFFGEAKTWKDITEKVRSKLIISATTQIKRSEWDGLKPSRDIPENIRQDLKKAYKELGKRRLDRGGKKSYDIMVVAYFNDMIANLKETYKVLSDGAHYCLILGDSAPYGVHIPTDEYLARVGLEVGFGSATVKVLRERGGKWTSIKGDRRHEVPLRESMVILKK